MKYNIENKEIISLRCNQTVSAFFVLYVLINLDIKKNITEKYW